MVECQKFSWDLNTVVLVNLDCDQIFEGSYVAALRRNFSTRMRPEVIPVSRPQTVANGAGGSLTGRIAYTCISFLAIGGYDEEEGVLGSGYQDVDITLRINCQAAKIIIAGCATHVEASL